MSNLSLKLGWVKKLCVTSIPFSSFFLRLLFAFVFAFDAGTRERQQEREGGGGLFQRTMYWKCDFTARMLWVAITLSTPCRWIWVGFRGRYERGDGDMFST